MTKPLTSAPVPTFSFPCHEGRQVALAPLTVSADHEELGWGRELIRGEDTLAIGILARGTDETFFYYSAIWVMGITYRTSPMTKNQNVEESMQAIYIFYQNGDIHNTTKQF